MTDAEGDTAWQVVYDGYGAVLTGTMPVTLTHTLLDMPDGTTGLVYQGNGRYYDPALGRPLQPNPAGAPPTAPQALNRYAATALGQPGVFHAQSQPGFAPLLTAAGSNAISAGAGMAISAYAKDLVGDLLIQTTGKALQTAGMTAFFRRVPGISNHYYLSGLVKQLDDTIFRTVDSGQIIDLARLETEGMVKYPAKQAFAVLDDTVWKQFLRTRGGELAAGFGINLILSVPDLIAPWQNPYFNDGQRAVQNLVTVGGAAASAGAGVWVGSLAAASGWGGPVTFVLVTGTGVIVYAAWEHAIRPAVSWIFTSSGGIDPYQEIRKLKPIGN